MKKKFLIVATLLVIFSFFTFSYTFAANNTMDNAVNGVRNFVGGTENVIEDASRNAANGIRSGINSIDNSMQDANNDMMDNGNATTGSGTPNATNENTNYTATRTGTDTTGATGLFGNVSNSVWSWLILAIVGIIIVALVLFYANQNRNVTTYHNDDNE